MTEERIRFRRKKQVLTLAHIFFVLIAVFGISAMYLNSNYGKGIKWVFEEAYEDSPQFTSQLSSDIGRIFTYVGYKGMFETDGVLDMNKVIVGAERTWLSGRVYPGLYCPLSEAQRLLSG